jgi:L-serine dehydratase
LMTIEVDQLIDEVVIDEISSLTHITQVTRISD